MPSAQIDALFRQAFEHHRAGRSAEAETLFHQILAIDPNSPDVLNSLALLRHSNADTPQAIELLRSAILLNPSEPAYHFNLGIVLSTGGNVSEAADAFRAVLGLNPRHAQAAANLGFIEYERGDLNAAVSAWQIALESGNPDPELHFALGSALRELGRPADAIPHFQRALELQPNLAEAANNLGLAHRDLGHLDPAIAIYRNLLAAHSGFGQAWHNLGLLMLETARHDEALDCFGRAVGANAGPQAASGRLYSMLFNPSFDPREILSAHEIWNQQFARPLGPSHPPHTRDFSSERRLRVGYVSPNFRNHVVGRFMLPLCNHHDHVQFETFFYDDNPISDSVTGQLQSCADVWRKTHHLTDADLAGLVAEDHIDILVDLNMHMERGRLLAFARRPAPIQVAYLAYAGTTGLEVMDYRLTDPYLNPPGFTDKIYSERSMRLAQSYWCYPPPDEAPQVGPMPADTRGHITFGCFNSFSKINREVLEVWAAILRRTPDSRLHLHSPEGSHRQSVLDTMTKHDVAPGRITFVSRTSGRDYFSQYCQIDIALDPFPYPGGTTTCDALWMGVPVITVAGQGAIARGGVSILSNVGLPDLIADSPAHYFQLALTVASDLPRLRGLRAKLRDMMQASPLMDARRFTQDIEAAYRKMWTNYIVDGSP